MAFDDVVVIQREMERQFAAATAEQAEVERATAVQHIGPTFTTGQWNAAQDVPAPAADGPLQRNARDPRMYADGAGIGLSSISRCGGHTHYWECRHEAVCECGSASRIPPASLEVSQGL